MASCDSNSATFLFFVALLAIFLIIAVMNSPNKYVRDAITIQNYMLSPINVPSETFEHAAFIEWPPLQPYTSSKYPIYEPLLDIVRRWNPDDPDQPDRFVETLQHFNYSDPHERLMAEKYREAEVPFKLYDVSELEQTRLLWTKSYLSKQLQHNPTHVEKSKNNHFMYWTKKSAFKKSEDYTPPTDFIGMSFDQWSLIAENADASKISNSSEHYYFMTGSKPRENPESFISKDLPMFSTKTPNFFIVVPEANKGIQCRFGMRGIISESHYDTGRNMVAMIRGRKRYILTSPSSCKYLGIISDKKHPSFRHSIIDWSDFQQGVSHSFDKVKSIDTIVRTGEVLYIPSFWFHYIISLDYSIQCNSRSGVPDNMEGAEYIEHSNCINSKIPPRMKKQAGSARRIRNKERTRRNGNQRLASKKQNMLEREI